MTLPRSCALVACALLSACGGGSSGSTPTTPTPTATTTFQGTIAGSASQSGTLTVAVQGSSSSGSVHLAGGGTTSLNGTMTSNALSLSGGGFTFTGTLAGSVMSGTYTGPGAATGGFSALNTSGGTVTAYCGNIFSNGPGQSNVITGVFNIAVSGSTASGAFAVGSNAGLITGQVSGTSFSITYTDRATGAQGTGTGTIQGGAMSGISVSSNPFSGSTGACQ